MRYAHAANFGVLIIDCRPDKYGHLLSMSRTPSRPRRTQGIAAA
jgi:hypothetical protein